MKPLFIYQIPNHKTWYIVITNTSKHFYFNNENNSSYWQLSDIKEKHANINIDQFMQDVDFDEIALLVAKSRGLKTSEKEPKQEVEDKEEKPEIIIRKEQNLGEEKKQENIKPTGNGFEGYSSSSDEEEVVDEEEGQSKKISRDEIKSDFISFLNSHSSKISTYQPWDLIEDDLKEELAQNKQFQHLTTIEKEELYKNWDGKRDQTLQQPNLYPSPKILYYKLLQEFKNEINKHREGRNLSRIQKLPN
ncbi:unnamed protein product [Candida verbasci]|uniref:FF domain-containing protein n=1 Tax=Candida verbasci TaxID=1227364 RepID=A0A9W4XAW8_9ASCO|nr:unnamed protein product [Candida verbasci]